MDAILIRCPECGGKLSVPPSATETACEYCGAKSQIRRRKGLLERAETPTSRGNGLPVALQQHSTAWRIGLIAIPTVMICAAFPIIANQRAAQRERAARLASVQANLAVKTTPPVAKKPPPRPEWFSQGAALVDVNNDGKLDVIGRVYFQPSAEQRFVAYNGVDGSMLWTSDDLGMTKDGTVWPFAVAGNSILFANPKTQMRAFAIGDGTARWAIDLPEKLETACAGDDAASAIVQLEDKRWFTLTLANGALELLAVPPPCRPLDGDSAYLSRAGQLQIDPPFEYGQLALDGIDGVRAPFAIFDSKTETLIALAEKNPGTAVPMLIAYQRDAYPSRVLLGGLHRLRTAVSLETRKELDRQAAKIEKQLPRSKAKVLWSVTVPSSAPLEAKPGALPHRNVALQDDIVVAAYEGAAQVHYLTAFKVEDGTRLWEIQLPAPNTRWLSRVIATAEHVYVVRGRGVEAYTLRDGKAAYILPLQPEN